MAEDTPDQRDDDFLRSLRGKTDGIFDGLIEKSRKYLGEDTGDTLGDEKPRQDVKAKFLTRDQQLVERYQKLVARILETPMLLAHVFSVPPPKGDKKPTVIISCNGRFAEILHPDGISLEVGTQVRINA